MKDLEILLSKVLPQEKPDEISVTEGKEIHAILEGEYLDEAKKVFRKSYVITSQENFYDLIINSFDLPEIIAKYAGIQIPELQDLLFLDTETTGLAGGTGTVAFEVGLGWFEEDQFRVDQLFLTDLDGEIVLLQELEKYLMSFSTIVSFNGKSFDIPLLSSRFILNSLTDPFSELQQLDLLHLSRRIWKNSLPDCSLGTIEKQILNICRDRTKDIPGSEIPNEYFHYLQTRDATEMSKVIYHNYYDIVTMFFLLQRIAEILQDIDSVEFLEEIFGLAKLFSDQLETEKAILLFRKILQIHPNHHLSLKKLSEIHKKNKDYPAAVPLWEKAAKAGKIYAFVELAKYNEHILKNPNTALQYTQDALKEVYHSCYEQTELIDQLQHRLQRLQQKTQDEK